MELAIWFLEDDTGQLAVKIEIGLKGVWWEHCIIYGKDHKRVKIIKYKDGGYLR